MIRATTTLFLAALLANPVPHRLPVMDIRSLAQSEAALPATQDEGIDGIGKAEDAGSGTIGERQENPAGNVVQAPRGTTTRIENRIQNRLQNRIDRNYDPVVDPSAPFDRSQGKPR